MTATALQPQTPGRITTLDTLRHPAYQPDISMGFGSLQSFELMQRAAKLLCNSTLVPTQYRAVHVKTDRYGNIKEQKENPNALANAVVALNMAQRMGADPLMIMQNLYVIEGRPSWSSQFIIAAINGCGKFSPLRFNMRELGAKSTEYQETFWENNQRQSRDVAVDIEDVECIAWAIERETGEKIEGPPVTISMAVAEGWYTKNGSKWQTMPSVMLRYRAASFFGKLYAPELLMGLKTVEEEQDIIDVVPETGEVVSVTTESLRTDMKKAEVAKPAESKEEPKPTPPRTTKKTDPPGSETVTAPSNGEASHPTVKESFTVQQEDPPHPTDESPTQEPPHPAEQGEETVPDPPKISETVKKFMREINQASTKGSVAVDQWRAKHNPRVARECGGIESPEFGEVMDYAQMTYQACLDAEKEAQA